MLRTISLAVAAGLLTVGVAACGTPAPDNGSQNTPSPTAKAVPDAESCTKGKALALLAGLRMAGVAMALELKTQADAADTMGDVVDQATQATAKVTDPQVKAIVDEYVSAIDQLKKQLEAPRADTTTLQADVDVATATFDKAEQKLSAICVESAPSPPASGGPRAAACATVENATLELVGPMMELGMMGTERAKIEAAAKKVIEALDAYATKLGTAAGETTDSEMKTAITAAATDIQKMKQAVVSAGTDATKLEAAIGDETHGASQEKLQTLCSS
jgi:hypothetical protein